MKKFLSMLLLAGAGTLCVHAQVGMKLTNQSSRIAKVNKVRGRDKVLAPENYYVTANLIRYNYYKHDIVRRDAALKVLKSEIYTNSKDTVEAQRFTDTVINQRLQQIENESDTLRDMRVIRDSLYYEYTKEYLKINNYTILSFGPLRSAAFFDMIYGAEGKRFQTLNQTGFHIGNNTGSIYSELVSGNLGLIRVSMGTMVSSSTSDSLAQAKTEEAFQRLVTYGGNTVLNFEYPLAYIHSNNNHYNLISRAVARGTADFPAFGTTTDDWAGSASVGLDIYADASLSNNSLRFFANFNINKIYGTDVFRDNLGIPNTDFTFGQLTLGLVLLNNIKLSFIVSTISSEETLRNKHVVIGGQILH